MERLYAAVRYGADAVYIGAPGLNLRAYASGFTLEEIGEGVRTAHSSGVKVYAAVNVFAHNRHLDDAPGYLKKIAFAGVDGLIISDPGIFMIARRVAPDTPVHLSTQAGVTNRQSALFWQEHGCKRIVLARELTLEEIKEISQNVNLELEVFVHGAMCLAYSGRCILSSYYTGRSGNRGECTQPCRWSYELHEADRQGDPLLLTEEDGESFILSSRDLNMINYIPELVNSGVDALKIEGRMKGVHYVATVTRVYREALDRYSDSPAEFTVDSAWIDELEKVSHRPYHTGFFFGKPEQVDPADKSSYRRKCTLAGTVLEYDESDGVALIEQRNFFKNGDELEVFSSNGNPFRFRVEKIYDLSGEAVDAAPHPRQLLRIPVRETLHPGDILRKYVE